MLHLAQQFSVAHTELILDVGRNIGARDEHEEMCRIGKDSGEMG